MAAERVAVLMKSYLGDAVMAEPVLRTLGQSPHPTLVLTSLGAREVVGHLEFDQFQRIDPGRRTRTILRRIRDLRAWRPEIAIIVDRSFRAALVARLAGAKVRVGHARDARAGLLTTTLPYDEDRYEAAAYADLAEAAGISVPPPHPRLQPTVEPLELPSKAIGFQPGARYEAKRIPEAASRALVASLPGPVILFGGAEEREQCERVASPSSIIIAGSCSIPQTIATLARLSAFVSADTGLSHLAFGVGIPSLAVFGPTRASKWSHGGTQRVLVAPDGRLETLSPEALLAAFSSSFSPS